MLPLPIPSAPVIQLAGGKSASLIIEAAALAKCREKRKDLALEPNDVAHIPKSFL